VTSETVDYPVRVTVQRPDSQSRLTNFPLFVGTFIRFILLIPHLIILYFFQIAAYIIHFIATFAILFTGAYPRGLFDFYVNYQRWTANVYGYFLHLYDDYPPFSGEPQQYPLTLEVDYPESLSRLLNLPSIGLVIKSILLIPHWIILAFLGIALVIVVFIALFAILFTGSFPEDMYRFSMGVGRWYLRATAYLFALTDKYPPFSLS
jgi:hypothetical protein